MHHRVMSTTTRAGTLAAALNDASALAHPADMPRYTLADMPSRIGQVLGTSPWITIDQARIDTFAHTTIDPQWIHVDPVRAAQGPFKTTIAHGFLTLSMMAWFGERAFAFDGLAHSLNYGMDRVRFPAPVPVGSRLRGVFRLVACEPIENGQGWQVKVEATIELEGSAKPACVAELLTRRYPASTTTP